MIIDDFNIVGFAVFPAETNTPLVIDPNAVLAFSVPCKLLKSISGRDADVIQCLCGIEKQKFPERRPA